MTSIRNHFEALVPGKQTPIERVMQEILAGNLLPAIKWRDEVDVPTVEKTYRADFLIVAPTGERIVVECDGADFHEFWADQARDTKMLTEGGIADVIRFRGCDLVHEPEACLRWIRTFFPHLFKDGAELPTFADRALVSIGLKSIRIQPIIRTIVRTSDLLTIRGFPQPCMCVTPVDNHSAIVQLKSPYWRVPNQGRSGVQR